MTNETRKIVENIMMLENKGYASKKDTRYEKIQELKEKLKEMRHKCGCKTKKFKDGVMIFPCDYHRDTDKWIYVALQHEEENSSKRSRKEKKNEN
jgi:hypothetical protein